MSLSLTDSSGGIRLQAENLAAQALAWASRQPLAYLAMLTASAMAVIDLIHAPSRLTTMLGDTDDATRLIEVRQLVHGQGWFDMTISRYGGAEPLVSHWSRLIDLPLAASILLLTPIFGEANAELITRMLWPTLLSGVLLYVIARYVESVSTRNSALLAMVLAAPAMGHCQFVPGRIDHHSGMIIGALGGTFALLGALDRPRLGWVAGALFGIGCAIGLEGLGLTAAVFVIVTLATIAQNGSLAGIARAAAAYAATLIVGHAAFGPFSPGGAVVCDALSTNLILLSVMSAFGVGLAHYARCDGASRLATFGYAAAFGIAGLGLYVVSEPACLHGPYGQLDPALGPIWLDNVMEVQTPFLLLGSSMLFGIVAIVYLPFALAYGVVVLANRRIPHIELYAAIFIVAMVMGLWQIRLLTYASYLAVPLIVWGLHRTSNVIVPPRARLGQWVFAVTGICGVLAIAVPFFMTKHFALAPPSEVSALEADQQDCLSATNIAPLNVLPPGLAINDMDVGPYIAAHTRLSVLAAPYHRIGGAILATHEFMYASVAEAKPRMKQLGARYVILCAGAPSTFAVTPAPGDATRAALLAGHTPDFLEPVAIAGTPLKVWRLKDK